MAPVQPKSQERKPSAKELRMQRITGQIHHLAPSKTFRPNASTSDTFLSTKRDKRLIKTSSFLSKVSASSSSGVTKPKRRRPNKKLATTLESLGDALPELDEEEEWQGIDGGNRGKVRMRGLKSRPGAMKKKERVVKGEMERFGVSMARLGGIGEVNAGEVKGASGKGDGGKGLNDGDDTMEAGEEKTAAPAQGSNRWAALRGYIASTMEQNPAFLKKQQEQQQQK